MKLGLLATLAFCGGYWSGLEFVFDDVSCSVKRRISSALVPEIERLRSLSWDFNSGTVNFSQDVDVLDDRCERHDDRWSTTVVAVEVDCLEAPIEKACEHSGCCRVKSANCSSEMVRICPNIVTDRDINPIGCSYIKSMVQYYVGCLMVACCLDGIVS